MWLDDLEVKVFITTSGDYVSLGTRTDYPFQSGGPNGNPLGWTTYDSGGAPTDVNRSVGLGRFNISNAGAVNHASTFYGCYRDFPISFNKRYIFQVQARQMEGKSFCQRNLRYEWRPSASGSGSFADAYSDWEQVSIYAGPAPLSQTHLRVVIQGVAYSVAGVVPGIDWGVQFQNFAIIEQDASYPEPTWEEVSCDVRSMSTRYGRDKFTNRYDVATLALGVLNEGGKFTYKPNGTLRPGRFIKVSVKEKSEVTTHGHFYGVIDSLADSYALDGTALSLISCVDISSLLSNMEVPTASWGTSTFKSGDRFRNLLNAVGWRSQGVDSINTGVYTQQAILNNGRTVRDELGLIADSEGSYFFADRDGQLVYRDRNWAEASVTQVTAELLAHPEPADPEPIVGTKFQFPGIYGNNLSSPTPRWPTGGIDVRARVRHDSVTSGQAYITKYQNPGPPTYFDFQFYRNSGHRLQLFWAGTSRGALADVPFGAGQTHWVRATRHPTTGAFNFYYAADNEGEPTEWTQAGAEQISATIVAPPNNPIPMKVGEGYQSANIPMRGRIHRVIIRDGIGGPILIDVSDDNASSAGVTSFIGSTGETWAVNQTSGQQVVQDDSYTPPAGLPVVDSIPTLADAPVICIRDLEPQWSRDRVVNEVSLANQGGSAFITVDAESQRKYGPRTFQRLDLLNVNDHPEYLTERTADLMAGYTEAILRVNTVQFRPSRAEGSYEWALRAFLNHLVRVRYENPVGGWGFAVVSHVQGLEHSFSLRDWVVTLTLDNPESFVYWETPELGTGWDVGGWDDDIWDGAADPNTAAYWDAKYPWSDPVSKWGN
jgi:hypothetical protein